MDANHHIWHLGWFHSNCSLFDSMTDLSPATRKVLDATMNVADTAHDAKAVAAAAIRTAVKCTRKQKVLRTLGVPMVKGPVYCLESALLAISDELEGL